MKKYKITRSHLDDRALVSIVCFGSGHRDAFANLMLVSGRDYEAPVQDDYIGNNCVRYILKDLPDGSREIYYIEGIE